jgi:signal transduction histidine kinase
MLTKQACIFLAFSFFLATKVLGQGVAIDTTVSPDRATIKDSISISFYINVSQQYASENSNKALHYGMKALELASVLEYEKGKLNSLQNLGRICTKMGNYELALDYQHQALEAYEKKQNEIGAVGAMNELANIYMQMKEFEQAMEYKFQALEIEERLKDSRAIADTYNQMGELYAELDNNELALNYTTKAVELREKLGDKRGIADSYKVFGLIHAKAKAYRQALDYFRKSLEMKATFKNSTDLGNLANSMGDVYITQGNPDHAAVYYKQAYEEEKKLNNRKGMAYSLINLGKCNNELKNHAVASNYLLEALALSKETESKEFIDLSYFHLSQVYEKSNNVAEALKYYKLYTDYQKLIFDENTSKKVAEMHEIIETARREKAIVILNKEKKIKELELKDEKTKSYNLILWFVIVAVLFFTALFSLWFFNKRNVELKAKNDVIRHKNEMMEDLNNTKNKFFSIIAHDLKGPLNSLTGFSNLIINHVEYLSKEEIKMMAVDIDKSVRNLIDLLNNLLTWARSQMDNIEFKPQNLQATQLFAEIVGILQLNAQNKKINLLSNANPDIWIYADENAVKTILRNLASNALKFTNEGGKVTMSAKIIDDKFVQLAVNDTGIGMDEQTLDKIFRLESKHSTKGTQGEAGTGLGLLLCKEFAEKNNGSISVESIAEVGTTFKVLLPIGKVAKLE